MDAKERQNGHDDDDQADQIDDCVHGVSPMIGLHAEIRTNGIRLSSLSGLFIQNLALIAEKRPPVVRAQVLQFQRYMTARAPGMELLGVSIPIISH